MCDAQCLRVRCCAFCHGVGRGCVRGPAHSDVSMRVGMRISMCTQRWACVWAYALIGGHAREHAHFYAHSERHVSGHAPHSEVGMRVGMRIYMRSESWACVFSCGLRCRRESSKFINNGNVNIDVAKINLNIKIGHLVFNLKTYLFHIDKISICQHPKKQYNANHSISYSILLFNISRSSYSPWHIAYPIIGGPFVPLQHVTSGMQ